MDLKLRQKFGGLSVVQINHVDNAQMAAPKNRQNYSQACIRI